jgi:putative hydrolase of the HAD superfamily
MPPQFFYFDIGNVLLAFDHDRMIRQMAAVAAVGETAMREAILPSEDETDLQWALEAGQITENDYYEQLCKTLSVRPPRKELNFAASDIFEPMEPTLRLVERMQRVGLRLGLLSNTNSVHWRFFLDGRYPVLSRCFEQTVSSFEAQSMKPDSGIYRLAIEKAKVLPSDIFFVDDKEENVAGAIACGIDAVLFTGADDLEAALRERGVEFV